MSGEARFHPGTLRCRHAAFDRVDDVVRHRASEARQPRLRDLIHVEGCAGCAEIDAGADDGLLARVKHRYAYRITKLRRTGILVSLDSRIVIVVPQKLAALAPRASDQFLREHHPVDVRPRQVRRPAFAKRLGCMEKGNVPGGHDPQVDGTRLPIPPFLPEGVSDRSKVPVVRGIEGPLAVYPGRFLDEGDERLAVHDLRRGDGGFGQIRDTERGIGNVLRVAADQHEPCSADAGGVLDGVCRFRLAVMIPDEIAAPGAGRQQCLDDPETVVVLDTQQVLVFRRAVLPMDERVPVPGEQDEEHRSGVPVAVRSKPVPQPPAFGDIRDRGDFGRSSIDEGLESRIVHHLAGSRPGPGRAARQQEECQGGKGRRTLDIQSHRVLPRDMVAGSVSQYEAGGANEIPVICRDAGLKLHGLEMVGLCLPRSLLRAFSSSPPAPASCPVPPPNCVRPPCGSDRCPFGISAVRIRRACADAVRPRTVMAAVCWAAFQAAPRQQRSWSGWKVVGSAALRKNMELVERFADLKATGGTVVRAR